MFAYIAYNLLDLTFGPDERPMVFDRLNAIELNEARAGNAMDGFTRSVRYEMEMKFFHECGR